jgi:hypothetical protein
VGEHPGAAVVGERGELGHGRRLVVGDTLGTIIGLGLGIGELTRHVERVRRRFNDTPHMNLT